MMSYPEFILCIALAVFAASIIGTYIIKRERFAPILPISIFIVLVALASLLMMSCGYVATIPQAEETAVPSAPIKTDFILISEPDEQHKTVTVTADTLYIRSCASTACNPFTDVPRGTHLRLVADNLPSKDPRCSVWVEIEIAGVGGFVCQEFVK